MNGIGLGIVNLLMGLLFLLRGGLAARVLIALWGAFLGFGGFALLGAGIAGSEPFGSPLSWILAVVGAVLLGWLGYAFYIAAVLFAIGSIGFLLAGMVAALLGASGGTATFIGLAVGILAALGAAALHVPKVLLVVVTAMGGATATVLGVMLLVGVLDPAEFGELPGRDIIREQWWWNLAWFVLAAVGIVVQLRAVKNLPAAIVPPPADQQQSSPPAQQPQG